MNPSKQAADAAQAILGYMAEAKCSVDIKGDLARLIDPHFAPPKEPPPGLLMSMALRYDHGLGCPGYYDQPIFHHGPHSASHARRLECTLGTMRQLWEEVTGSGFYRPEKEAEYVAMSTAATTASNPKPNEDER